MRWMLKLILLAAVIAAGAAALTYPQPFLKARDTDGQRLEAPLSSGGTLVAYRRGAMPSDKPLLVMFPSAGREASDFNELADTLYEAGYPLALIQPPHIDGAVPSVARPTLFQLAQDCRHVCADWPETQRIIFIGHAFGNRVARASATLYDDQTAGVVLIAAGAERPVPKAANDALIRAFDPTLLIGERKEAVRYAFFADGNDIPDYWLRGWHSKTAQLQGATRQNSPPEDWRAGGTAPMLVIAGLQDRVAPPEDTIDLLERDYPGRVTGVRLDGAGHALLPEKPGEIANAILAWLESEGH